MKFTGTHIAGRGRARTLGFPTINLHDINTLTIEDGVYAARATINKRQYNAALFIGESPTFKDKEKTVELHLIGIPPEEAKISHLDPIRETKIGVETIQYIRPVVKFKSKGELIHHIGKNIEEIKEILAEAK